MMVGTVNDRLELLIRLPVLDGAGQPVEVEAALDTGFDGSLTLPTSLVAQLGLPWRSRGDAVFGNGQVEGFDLYRATVVWNKVPRQILVHAIDTSPLLGTALLVNHNLRIRMVPGGDVQIEQV